MAAPEESATLPPPAGEDNAYEAATKVGAMPAEVMARLRAEGLLPEEEPQTSAPTPNSSLHTPTPAPPRFADVDSPSSDKPVPQIFSSAPPKEEDGGPLPRLTDESDPVEEPPLPTPEPTPIAFASAGPASSSRPAPIAAAPSQATPPTAKSKAPLVVFVLLLLVAFFVAWLRSRG